MTFSFLILEQESSDIYNYQNIIESMNFESKVYTVSDTDEAIEKAKEVNIDVFLFNIRFDDAGSMEFLRKIRNLYRLTPIIIISSHNTVDQKFEAFNKVKLFAIIEKPVYTEIFKFEVEKALEISKLLNYRTVSFKRKNYIKNYATRDIYCIQRVPNGKKKILITSFDDTVNELTTESFSIKSSLGEILDLFENKNDIIRVHQSWLVNPAMIRGLHLSKEELTLAANIKIPLGETYKHQVIPFIDKTKSK